MDGDIRVVVTNRLTGTVVIDKYLNTFDMAELDRLPLGSYDVEVMVAGDDEVTQ
jgi:hypothetical protein